MSNAVIMLTPLLVLLILAVFGFAGCARFTEAPTPPVTLPGPPLVIAPPDPVPTKPAAEAYVELVAGSPVIPATPGFAALWPFNETGGNVANVVGTHNPGSNGLYAAPSVPVGTGYKVGQDGVLFTKDKADHAPAFDGTGAWVEVQFNGAFNPVKNAPSGFTVELWVKPNPTAGGATQVLISSHRFDSAGAQQGYEIALVRDPAQQNQQVRARVFANGTMTTATAKPTQGDSTEWRYIVFTYRATSATTAVVSIEVKIVKSSGAFLDGPHGANYEPVLSAKPSSLRFGAGHAAGQTAENFFVGRMDNVAIYNAILSQKSKDDRFGSF